MGTTTDTDQVCQDLLDLLSRMKHELFLVAEAQGLTHVQLSALHMLHKHGDLAMGEVAQVLRCDPSNVTGIIDRLVTHGFVVRRENAQDRRARTISLTDHGRRVLDEIMQSIPKQLGCQRLSSEEREAFHKTTRKLIES